MNTLRDKIKETLDTKLTVDHWYNRDGSEGREVDGKDEASDTLQSIAEDFAVKLLDHVAENNINLKGAALYGIVSEFRDNFYSHNIKEGEKG